MSRTRPADRLRFYFSFRSPYSWLTYRDLLDSSPELAERLEWIPFWEPDEWSERLLAEAGGQFVYTPMSRAKHLYILQDVRRLASDRGLTVTWPVDRDPCWEIPHLAYLVAVELGCGREFAEVVHRARWQENRDICSRDTIAELATSIGADAQRLAGAADDPWMRALGTQVLMSIYSDGVFGVPFFVHGFEKFWGLERLPVFKAQVMGTDRRPAAPDEDAQPGRDVQPAEVDANGAGELQTAGRTSDGGHAGGCG